MKWFGYMYQDGNLQAKRYFEPLDISEARESPFVSSVTGPFEAEGRDEALQIVKDRLT